MMLDVNGREIGEFRRTLQCPCVIAVCDIVHVGGRCRLFRAGGHAREGEQDQRNTRRFHASSMKIARLQASLTAIAFVGY